MNQKTEFDKPPLPHTLPQYDPPNRFNDARRKYEGYIGNAVVRAANWRLIAFCAIGLSFLLGGGLIYAASRPDAVPYYIEVDKTGAVGNITKASQDYDVKDASIEYFIGKVIQDIRNVPKDAVQLRKNADEAGVFLTKTAGKQLNELMKHESPLEDIKKDKATDTEILGVSKVAGSNNIYQVRWEEKKYDKSELKDSYTMTGFVTIVLAEPKEADKLIVNPFGIYIDDISWSRER